MERPDPRLHQAVDYLLDRPVTTHGDHSVVPTLCGVKREIAGMTRSARLNKAGARPGESNAFVQPRTEAPGPALAGRGIHDQKWCVERWHAPDCALAVNVQSGSKSVRREIRPLTPGADRR